MPEDTQTITVYYDNESITCQLCNINEKSNGSMCILDTCKHQYHIKCLIQNCKKECPKCNIAINDIRLSIAIAFQKHNTSELLDVLVNN
jgi:hypothetical protein